MAVRRLTNQPRDTVRSHGIGKGFMAMQRLTQLGGVNLPTCVENDHGACSRFPPSTSKKPPAQVKKNPRRKQPVKVCFFSLFFVLLLLGVIYQISKH